MHTNHPPGTLQRFFAGLTEYVFSSRLGVADPALIDYLSALLSRFVRCDALHRLKNVTGSPLAQVADMLVEAQARVGEARREAHRHIGDFTLFWVGVYPEALPRLRSPDRKDHLIDYRGQGKQAYFLASTIAVESPEEASSEVLGRLSDEFDLCAFGLRQVRRQWQEHDGDTGSDKPLLFD
jgi:hypothetical protein